MGKGSNRTRIAAFVVVLTLFGAACSESAPSGETEVPTSLPNRVTTTSTTTTQPAVTTIPTTSIPSPTLSPPDLPQTTTTVPEVAITPDTVPEGTIIISPDDNLAATVRQSPEGSSFLLLPGTHRIEDVIPKTGMTFEGMTGAIVSGAVLLEGFEPADLGWEYTGITLNMDHHGECVGDYQACGLRNDLFVDDTMLWRVDDLEELEAGTWWSDGRTIVVADDPEGRKIEVSLTEFAFVSDADDITIRHLVVEKFASLAQSGAIQAQLPGRDALGSGWLIEHVEARLNHAAGIRTGDNTTIRAVRAHHNGQQGITGDSGSGILVESSEIDNNNLRGFSYGWEAGGAKFTRTDGLVVRNVIAHHNLGPGLWTDIDCYDTTYEDNVVYSNIGPGIFHEISFDAVIRNNEVYDNGFAQDVWLWGAGILVAASTDVEVYDNVVTNNADGIAGIQQVRENSDGPWLLADLYVHNNTITMWYGQTGVVEDVGDDTLFTDRNLVFENNTYVGAGHEAFAWDGWDLSWDAWLETGQGVGSVRSDG